ncbi:MAG: hypothetical protein JSV82_00215 [Planctomycetota bacterium]|nr:MAG: hypothetical protein JSV82_00215 [Planctomycetota bacterium]
MLVDNFVKLSRRSRNSVFAASTIIVAITLYSWIVTPHTSYLYAAQRYKYAINSIAVRNKTITEAVSKKAEELVKLRKKTNSLQNTLFSVSQAKEFFSDLQAISTQAGCIVHSLNFSELQMGSETASGLSSQRAILSVVGMYDDITMLLERLLKRSQKVYMQSVRMRSMEGNLAQIRCDITIMIYIIKDIELGQSNE